MKGRAREKEEDEREREREREGERVCEREREREGVCACVRACVCDVATHHFGCGDFARHKLDKCARRRARCNVLFAQPKVWQRDEDVFKRRSVELHLLRAHFRYALAPKDGVLEMGEKCLSDFVAEVLEVELRQQIADLGNRRR